MRSNPQAIEIPDLGSLNDSDSEFLELAKRQYEEEQARWNQIEEKSRTLLTISGLLVPLTAGLLPSTNSNLPATLGLGCLLATTYVILQIFGVATVMYPSLDRELVSAPKDAQFRLLVEQFLKSAATNHRSNDFRVDLYRAAHRLFLASLVLIVLSGGGAMNSAFGRLVGALRKVLEALT